jgi:hypothetical protein
LLPEAIIEKRGFVATELSRSGPTLEIAHAFL